MVWEIEPGWVYVKGPVIERVEESFNKAWHFAIYVNLVLIVPDSCYSF